MTQRFLLRFLLNRKTTASALALALLVTGTAAPWVESSAYSQNLWSERREKRLSQSNPSSPNVTLPALRVDKELGYMTHIYRPFSTDSQTNFEESGIPLIVHFQEAHGNPAAQRNLAQLIPDLARSLQRSEPTKPLLVAVEGAWGPLDTEWFRSLPDTTFRDSLAKQFLESGWITGEEFLSVTQEGTSVRIFGVENPTLYKENNQARTNTSQTRLVMGSLLGTYSSPFKKLDATLPLKIRQFILFKNRFENGRMDISAYLHAIDSLGSSPWDRRDFPSLTQLLKTEILDQRTDIKEARKRIESALSQGTKTPPTSHDMELLASVIRQSSPLNPDLVRRDLDRLATLTIQQLIQSLPSSQRSATETLLRLKQWLQLHERLWSLTMTPEDWEGLQILERHMDWSSFQNDLTLLAGKHHVQLPPNTVQGKIITLAQSTQNLLMDFYRLAHRRDREMAIRTAELARSEGNGFAALVTGGFHSPGIRRWLRWAPANYIEITPHLTGSHTLRDASRFALDSGRVPISTLVSAVTLLHHPNPSAILKGPLGNSVRKPRVIEANGTRRLVGFAQTTKGSIPFLLEGTEEKPQLTEGREALSERRATLMAQGGPEGQFKQAIEALNILLSPTPSRTAFRTSLKRASSRIKSSMHSLLRRLQDFIPEGSSVRPSLLNGPMAEVFLGGLKPMSYFLPPQNSLSGDRTPEGEPTPEKLMKNALALVRNNSFLEAEQTLRRLHAIDRDDRWSGEFFRQLSVQERRTAGEKLSPLVWAAALNGHFTRLYEDHTTFLIEQYKAATELDKMGSVKKVAALKDHLAMAKITLNMFDMNTRSPATPGNTLHATEALQHNQTESNRTASKSSWGGICIQMENLARLSTLTPENESALKLLLQTEKDWLSVRLRNFTHPRLSPKPETALWFVDDFLLPSIYGEYRQLSAQAPPQIAQELRTRWEARRATARGRTLGLLSDFSEPGPPKTSDDALRNIPPFLATIKDAIQALPPGESTVRIQHPWPQTKNPLERELALQLRQGNGTKNSRKLWRINFGEIKQTLEPKQSISSYLKTLIQTVGDAGGNALVIDLDELDALFPANPDALAEAVQNLRRIERGHGITGPNRTSIFLIGSETTRDPLASLSGTTLPRFNMEGSPELVQALLSAKAKELLARGVDCPPEMLSHLGTAIQEGTMDLSLAEGLLERAGARAQARATSPTDLTRIERADLEDETVSLPPFEQLSLWRQAGIALHSMALGVGIELERNLNQLRRTPSNDSNHAPLMAYIRHILALRFLWPREPSTTTQDVRPKRSQEEQAALLKEWRKSRKHFRDELDLAITGQNELKLILEQTYPIHDFEQWGNPDPTPADMVLMEGPPGTGKTTIGKALAKAMGRKFIEINAGGTADPKRFKGLQRTFVGSQPSEITRQLEAAGTEDVLILIDEVDKMSRESLDALTDFLDKRQEYHDTYLGSHLRYRRPRVRVILTANEIDETIFPDHLLSRLKRTHTRRYSDKELIAIGLDHVYPETLRFTDYGENRVTVPDPTVLIQTIVSEYSPTNDVRDLQKLVRRVMSSAFHEWLLTSQPGQPANPVVVDLKFVRRILGVASGNAESVPTLNIVGQVNSLAANDRGGIVKPVQAYFRALPGEELEELIVTGLMHPDMKDSAHRAVLAAQQAIGQDTPTYGRTHFHIPGEFQKSGPSAGLAFLTALYSEMTGWPVKAGVAMTGEISPTGAAQRIGGLDKKLTAALQAGVHTVFLPTGNASELRDALSRNEHLRGRMDDGDQSHLYISNTHWTALSPLPPELHLAEQTTGGRWIRGSRSDLNSFLKDNPSLVPPLTCVLVHHGYTVLNQAIERPEGVPPLQVSESPSVLKISEVPIDTETAPPPQTINRDKQEESEIPTQQVAPPSTKTGRSPIHQLAFQTKPADRITTLQTLLASGKQEDARRVLRVLHVLASTGDPSLKETLQALPTWIEQLTRAVKESDLQALGVLLSRARETVFEVELNHFRKAVSKHEWLETTPTNAGEIARTVKSSLSNQLTRTLKQRDLLQGNDTRRKDFIYFNHVAVFLSQMIEDLPPETSYTGGHSLSFDENDSLKRTVQNYLNFMGHQLNDFPGQGRPLDALRKEKELPFITGIANIIQGNTLITWMATAEQHHTTDHVAMVAMSAIAENSLRDRLNKGELIDHSLLSHEAPLTDTETATFQRATEEIGRRLTTTSFRSGMFYSPDSSMATQFLTAASRYFRTQSPFINQTAQRVLAVHFSDTRGDPIKLLTQLKTMIYEARAVGDVVLAIDLDAFTRHFDGDVAAPLAFLLERARTQTGPQGAFSPLPLLFYGKEETHLALSDTSLPYDRAVQSYPILPPQAGKFLTEWMMGQVANRVGQDVKFDQPAQEALEDFLNREKDIDLSLVLSGLVSLAASSERGEGSTPLSAEEVNRAIGEALVAAEREPSNIQEYRQAARRIPDPQARKRLLTEISRLARRSPGSSDYQMLTNWIQAILAWPWREKPLPLVSPDQIPLRVKQAMEKLDQNVFGMTEIKKEIILHYELYLHQLSQGREPEMPIIALSGPPGTAKTLLARMIGDIFGIPSEVIACSGIDDSRHFVGFFRTYTSSEEGAIVKAYRKTKKKRMVLVFDELDKRRTGGHFGDPLNALTRYFDPKYRELTDDFLEQTLDVSSTLAIITMNRLESIPEHLQSRMVVLKVNEPTREEKIGMAREILLPRLLKSKGFSPTKEKGSDSAPFSPVVIDSPAALVTRLVDDHLSPRDDARKIEQKLNQLLSSAFSDYVDTGVPVHLNAGSLEQYLGPSLRMKATRRGTDGTPEVGRVIIPVQESALLTSHAIKRPGTSWKLQLPLALGDKEGHSNTLAETVRTTWELALSAVLKRFPNAAPGTIYLHLDVNDARPDQRGLGFAGLGILASLVSSLTERTIPSGITLGGTIDLKGNVLPLDIEEQGKLERKILRSAGEGLQTFYFPTGKTTRKQLETTMRRHALLRGIIIENGTAELTLVGTPGPMDPSDSSQVAQQRKQEADLWNRLLESLPAKAVSAGLQTSQEKIPLEELQELKDRGLETTNPFVESVTLKGSEKDLIQFINQQESLRIELEKDNSSTRSAQDHQKPYSPTRYVLVSHVDEALNDLFPTTDENAPTPPKESGRGTSLKSIALGVATAITLMGTIAPSPAPAASLIEAPHRETSLFVGVPETETNHTLSAIRLLGNKEKPGSPLHQLAQQAVKDPTRPPEPTLADQVADQMSTLSSPETDSDISPKEWNTAWGLVSDFMNRRPRRSLTAASRRKGDPTLERTNDFYRTLEEAIQSPSKARNLVLVDWGMVASRPDEVAKLLTNMSKSGTNQPEIAFLDSEGNEEQMRKDLDTAGLSRWKTSHIVDRKALQEAEALSETGQVDLPKVDAFLQSILRKNGRSPAPLTQVVVDPINAQRYLGEVVRLLMDVNEVVLQGDSAIKFLNTIGQEATSPIRTTDISYDPNTRTLRLKAQSIGTNALANFSKTILLIDSQA